MNLWVVYWMFWWVYLFSTPALTVMYFIGITKCFHRKWLIFLVPYSLYSVSIECIVIWKCAHKTCSGIDYMAAGSTFLWPNIDPCAGKDGESFMTQWFVTLKIHILLQSNLNILLMCVTCSLKLDSPTIDNLKIL